VIDIGARTLIRLPRGYTRGMPEVEFAFLADAAETPPGQKFSVLGGGVTRIGGPTFPLRHPHIALVICLAVTVPEFGREHEVRIVLLDPDGHEISGAQGAVVAQGAGDGRDTFVTFSVDLWSISFPTAGDYSFRILVNGSERKRLPMEVVHMTAPVGPLPGAAGPPSGQNGDPDTPRRFDA
jgi:hypothetical protein